MIRPKLLGHLPQSLSLINIADSNQNCSFRRAQMQIRVFVGFEEKGHIFQIMYVHSIIFPRWLVFLFNFGTVNKLCKTVFYKHFPMSKSEIGVGWIYIISKIAIKVFIGPSKFNFPQI